MPRTATLSLMLACLCASGFAAESEPMGSDACKRAIDTLNQEMGRLDNPIRPAAASAPAAIAPELARARLAAAKACLGPGTDTAPAPQRRVETPTSVPGVRMAPAPGPPPVTARPNTNTATPPPQSRLPQVLSSCDAAGCWTSDGTRLQRVGPLLNGPRGTCSVAGTAVTCP